MFRATEIAFSSYPQVQDCRPYREKLRLERSCGEERRGNFGTEIINPVVRRRLRIQLCRGCCRLGLSTFFSAAAVKRELVGVPGSSANGNGCTSAIVRRGFRRNGKLHRSAGSVRIRIRKRFRIFGERILQFLFGERYFSVTPNGKLKIRVRRLNLSSDCLTNGTEKERNREV